MRLRRCKHENVQDAEIVAPWRIYPIRFCGDCRKVWFR